MGLPYVRISHCVTLYISNTFATSCTKSSQNSETSSKRSKATMDSVSQLRKQWLDYIHFLRREGFLDEQYSQLRKLQHESNPDFVIKLVSIHFNDSQKVMNNVATVLEQNVVDFELVNTYVLRFKGSSAWIGALRVKNACNDFKNHCDAQNLEGCLVSLRLVKHECLTLKNNLENLFMLERQIVAAGGSVSDIE